MHSSRCSEVNDVVGVLGTLSPNLSQNIGFTGVLCVNCNYNFSHEELKNVNKEIRAMELADCFIALGGGRNDLGLPTSVNITIKDALLDVFRFRIKQENPFKDLHSLKICKLCFKTLEELYNIYKRFTDCALVSKSYLYSVIAFEEDDTPYLVDTFNKLRVKTESSNKTGTDFMNSFLDEEPDNWDDVAVTENNLSPFPGMENVPSFIRESESPEIENEDGQVKCKICGRHFKGISQLIQHTKTHAIDLVCKSCDLRFETRRHLRRHFKTKMHHNSATTSQEYIQGNDQDATEMDADDGRIKCQKCCRLFKGQTQLTQHMKTHAIDLTCGPCNVSFQTATHLRRHLTTKTHHNTVLAAQKCENGESDKLLVESEVWCKICEQKFVNMKQLITHEISHNKNYQVVMMVTDTLNFTDDIPLRSELVKLEDANWRQIICSLCDASFAYPYRLKQHRKLEHKIDDELNEITDDSSVSEQLKRPRRLRRKPRKILQDDADGTDESDPGRVNKVDLKNLNQFKFKRFKRRRRTRLISTKEAVNTDEDDPLSKKSNLICSICSRNFKHPQHLEQHMKSHNKVKHKCPDCSKEFRKLYLMEQHMNVHKGLTPFSCASCTKSFPTKKSMLYHFEYHHGTKTKYKCQKCCKVYYTSQGWRKHEKECQTLTGEPLIDNLCQICGKGFSRPEKLKAHQKIHMRNISYNCTQCLRSFVSRTGLHIHELNHEQEKIDYQFPCQFCGKRYPTDKARKRHEKYMHKLAGLHKCEICEKSFGKKNTLSVHMQVHTGLRSYLCPLCGKSYKNITDMKNHEIKAHKGESAFKFSCPVCNKKFHRRNVLRIHQVKEGHILATSLLNDLDDDTLQNVVIVNHIIDAEPQPPQTEFDITFTTVEPESILPDSAYIQL